MAMAARHAWVNATQSRHQQHMASNNNMAPSNGTTPFAKATTTAPLLLEVRTPYLGNYHRHMSHISCVLFLETSMISRSAKDKTCSRAWILAAFSKVPESSTTCFTTQHFHLQNQQWIQWDGLKLSNQTWTFGTLFKPNFVAHFGKVPSLWSPHEVRATLVKWIGQLSFQLSIKWDGEARHFIWDCTPLFPCQVLLL